MISVNTISECPDSNTIHDSDTVRIFALGNVNLFFDISIKQKRRRTYWTENAAFNLTSEERDDILANETSRLFDESGSIDLSKHLTSIESLGAPHADTAPKIKAFIQAIENDNIWHGPIPAQYLVVGEPF